MKRRSPSTFIDYSNDRRANWYIRRHNGSFGSTTASCPPFLLSLFARKSMGIPSEPLDRPFRSRIAPCFHEKHEKRNEAWIFIVASSSSRYLPSRENRKPPLSIDFFLRSSDETFDLHAAQLQLHNSLSWLPTVVGGVVVCFCTQLTTAVCDYLLRNLSP